MALEEICNISIDKEEERTGTVGKLLFNTFVKGPSEAVKSYGKVTVSQSQGQSSQGEQPGGQQGSNGSQSGGNEKYNYSILRASTAFSKMFEEDNPSEEESDEFVSGGGKYTVEVELPDEGITQWVISFNSNAASNIDKAITAIKSKDFLAAYKIASNKLGTDGFAVMSVSTSIHDRADKKDHCPFIGNCNYAFDSGSEETSDEDMTVCLAIAPLDMKTSKTNGNIVIKVVYDILGDISDGGSLKELLSSIIKSNPNENNTYSDEEINKVSDEVSKYLNRKFKCVGNSTMYENFKNIRNYVVKNIKANKLAYDKSYSQDIKKYADAVKPKEILITY